MEKKLNFIAGLPRSGSTLLCNILNQNPKVWASSTSTLPNFVHGVLGNQTNPDFHNLLNIQKEETEVRISNAIKGLCEGWYSTKEEPIIFDKNRMWGRIPLVCRDIAPEGKVIVVVRDLKDVFASCVKQDQKNSLTGITKPIIQHYNEAFDINTGIIGAPLSNIINLLHSKFDNVIFLQYNAIVEDPSTTMMELGQHCGFDMEGFNFDDVKNTAIDPDGFYLNKFPHKGEGKVEPKGGHWSDFVSLDIGKEINQKYQFYNQAFGFK